MKDLHLFWEKIAQELTGIFDTHGVCASIAQQVASFTHSSVVVGLLEPTGQYYDIWQSDPKGIIYQDRWRDQKGQIDETLNTGKIERLNKYTQRAKSLLTNPLWQMAENNLLLVPLPQPHGMHKIIDKGFMAILDPAEVSPLNEDNLLVTSQLFTAYIERAALRYERDRQAIEFALTSEISQSLTSTLNLQEIFAQVSADMRRILDVESLSLGLIDPETQNIIFIPELMGSMFLEIPPITLPPGEGIAGWVAQNKETIIVNDAYSDDRFSQSSDQESGFQTRSILCVPLQEKDRVIGIMEAINKRHGEFTEHDKKLLDALSGPLTAAIINAELHGNTISEKRRIETIFQSMSEGVMTIHAPDGIITEVNDALLSLLRAERDDLVGAEAAKAIKIRDNNFGEFLQEVLDHGQSSRRSDHPQLACEIRRSDHSFIPVLSSGASVNLRNRDEPTEAIIVFSDLTAVREVERMRDDFFHGIVHELRTPLALILMYARLLLQGAINDEEKSQRFLTTIANESDRLQTMVRQMLQLAKLEAQEIQRSSAEVNLNDVLTEMIEPLADKATEKGLTFIQRIENELPPIVADRDTIYLIFKNLIENAIKFTLEGAIRVSAKREGQMISIVVKDDGIGIPEEAMPNLFRRFFRARTAVERGIAGTGIGLYMVKEGIEKHRGTLDVESKVNEGTTFYVKLPVAPGATSDQVSKTSAKVPA
ncbi:MAG: ATP-binding protein [Ardenticatenaceae bacterium]|nr:ATP-binding protein [Ardenticatenaceae bacterium]